MIKLNSNYMKIFNKEITEEELIALYPNVGDYYK